MISQFYVKYFWKVDTYGGSSTYTGLNGDRTKNLLPIKAIVQSCEMVINVCWKTKRKSFVSLKQLLSINNNIRIFNGIPDSLHWTESFLSLRTRAEQYVALK